MTIQQNISLKPYNTFGIDARAAYFVEVVSAAELSEALKLDKFPRKLIISGGSNMLITGDLDALVIYLNIQGKEIVEEDEDEVVIRVMAGENWHELVLWTLERGYGGLENLSLIPGNTGTAPIQNIGAYGVELKDIFESCEAFDVRKHKLQRFSKPDCAFGYRDSFFKNEGKGIYIITAVDLRLTKRSHKLNTSYGAIEAELEKRNVTDPDIRDISKAVIAIRQSKLPDPKEIGNSGSFFKNPVLNREAFETFSKIHPMAPYYRVSDEEFKVPAGWLIEQCGYKGKRFGDAGVHKNQALVLVNYGGASGQEILDLSKRIQNEVQQKFGIKIVPEVNIIE